jgi:Na+/proline symporter
MTSFTNVSFVDISIIVIYLIGIIWWGLKNAKNKSSSDYFLAGRNMGWVMVGLSLFSASISTSTLIGHSGATFKYGLVIFQYWFWYSSPGSFYLFILNRVFIPCLSFWNADLTHDRNTIFLLFQFSGESLWILLPLFMAVQ